MAEPVESVPEDENLYDTLQAAVLARMTRAGWLTFAKNDSGGVVVRWTDAGKKAALQFGAVYDELGRDMTGPEIFVLLEIIENLSPGGSNPDENALD